MFLKFTNVTVKARLVTKLNNPSLDILLYHFPKKSWNQTVSKIYLCPDQALALTERPTAKYSVTNHFFSCHLVWFATGAFIKQIANLTTPHQLTRPKPMQPSHDKTLLTILTLWVYSSDVKLTIFFLIFPRKYALILHAKFAWKAKAFLLGKIRKCFKVLSAEKMACYPLSVL